MPNQEVAIRPLTSELKATLANQKHLARKGSITTTMMQRGESVDVTLENQVNKKQENAV